MEVNNDTQLKCISCGHSAYFEPNYDSSYIMCMYCHREYIGGYEELCLLNEEKFEIEKKNIKLGKKKAVCINQVSGLQ